MYPRWFSMRRPQAPIVLQQQRVEEPEVPFIPPTEDSQHDPVIPNHLHSIKAYRYRPSKNVWKHVPPPGSQEVREALEDEQRKYPTSVRIITWNVDFMTDHKAERLTACLRYLERDVLECKDGDAPFDPCCILLQEVHADVVPVLLKDEWVQRHFAVAPISPTKWPEGASYGNITLVSRVLTIVRSEIMQYGLSEMERTALGVYIMLSEPEPSASNVTICIVNTHLESLPKGALARPRQLELAARFLKQLDVRGGVVAGDMNAICQEDDNIALDAALRDAWRKGDKDESGFTWGYQGQGAGKFPPGRLDKVLYLPRRGYKLDPPERIAIGLKVKESNEAVWASDHYGLDTTLRMVARRNSS